MLFEKEKITKEEYDKAKEELSPEDFSKEYEVVNPRSPYETFFRKKIFKPSNSNDEIIYKIFKDQNEIKFAINKINSSVKFFVVITVIELVCQFLMSCSLLGH